MYQYNLLKISSFPIKLIEQFCQKSVSSPFCSIIHLLFISVCASLSHCLGYCIFIVSPKTSQSESPSAVFLFMFVLTIPESFCFHTNFRFHINFVEVHLLLQKFLEGVWLELFWIYTFIWGRMEIFKPLSPPIQELGIALHLFKSPLIFLRKCFMVFNVQFLYVLYIFLNIPLLMLLLMALK